MLQMLLNRWEGKAGFRSSPGQTWVENQPLYDRSDLHFIRTSMAIYWRHLFDMHACFWFFNHLLKTLWYFGWSISLLVSLLAGQYSAFYILVISSGCIACWYKLLSDKGRAGIMRCSCTILFDPCLQIWWNWKTGQQRLWGSCSQINYSLHIERAVL
jgi:hypothetical protein